MKSIFNSLLISLLLLAATGCSSGGSGSNAGLGHTSFVPGNHQLSGFVQKGPFIQGTTINIQELDQNLNPTGRVFLTQTTDYTGTFSLLSTLG